MRCSSSTALPIPTETWHSPQPLPANQQVNVTGSCTKPQIRSLKRSGGFLITWVRALFAGDTYEIMLMRLDSSSLHHRHAEATREIMAEEDGKLVGVIGDEDTVTGFLLAGVGHRTMEGANFLVVKNGKSEREGEAVVEDFVVLPRLMRIFLTLCTLCFVR